MTSLDAKLFAWSRLQAHYDAARERLKEAMGREADDATVHALHAEAERLHAQLNAALREIDELRRQRARPDA